MKTVIGALGNSIAGFYDRLPFYVRGPMIVCGTIFVIGELNIDVNHSFQSFRIFSGQAAQADAQSGDIQKARNDLKNGVPIAGASALLATQVSQGDATAKNTYATVPQTEALSRAAVESIEQIQDKVRRHQFVDSTETMRLLDYQTKLAQLQQAQAEASIKGQVANFMANDFGSESNSYDPVGVVGRLTGQPEQSAVAAPKANPATQGRLTAKDVRDINRAVNIGGRMDIGGLVNSLMRD